MEFGVYVDRFQCSRVIKIPVDGLRYIRPRYKKKTYTQNGYFTYVYRTVTFQLMSTWSVHIYKNQNCQNSQRYSQQTIITQRNISSY